MYRIENYARNIQDFRASNARNQALSWEQTDKQTWRISKQSADDVEVRYQVFSLQLTDQMADVAPPATFMYVVGQKHVRAPEYDARRLEVYTGLDKEATNYFAATTTSLSMRPRLSASSKVSTSRRAGRATIWSAERLVGAPQSPQHSGHRHAAIGVFGKRGKGMFASVQKFSLRPPTASSISIPRASLSAARFRRSGEITGSCLPRYARVCASVECEADSRPAVGRSITREVQTAVMDVGRHHQLLRRLAAGPWGHRFARRISWQDGRQH
jgi:hypothetical protein